MTAQEAFKILHPDTTVEAIAEIKYYAGFKGREAGIKAVEDACVVACEALEKQAEYKSLEEQGLLFRLPCKVGDVLWWIDAYRDLRNSEVNSMFVEQGIDGVIIETLICNISAKELGKTVFLTQEEAEAALEKMKGEEHEVN